MLRISSLHKTAPPNKIFLSCLIVLKPTTAYHLHLHIHRTHSCNGWFPCLLRSWMSYISSHYYHWSFLVAENNGPAKVVHVHVACTNKCIYAHAHVPVPTYACICNNIHEAALPSTTHPQSWVEPHIHVHTGKSLPSVPPSPEEHNLPSLCPSTPDPHPRTEVD